MPPEEVARAPPVAEAVEEEADAQTPLHVGADVTDQLAPLSRVTRRA